MIENKQLVVFPSVSRTASPNADQQANRFYRGVDIIIDITAVPGGDTVTFNVEGLDPASGKWYSILSSTALVGIGTTVLRIYPSLTAAANATANSVLPCAWRVRPSHSGSGAFVYSVGANLMK